jgi:hypothetical protein
MYALFTSCCALLLIAVVTDIYGLEIPVIYRPCHKIVKNAAMVGISHNLIALEISDICSILHYRSPTQVWQVPEIFFISIIMR